MNNVEKSILIEKHSRWRELLFRAKSSLLKVKRSATNTVKPVYRFYDLDQLKNELVIAVSESELWNPFDNQKNWILTAGKVENLRIAARRIHGIEVEAGEIFSFWRHIGNPNFGKGYVVGREIREGCIVPTVAGGLCQLSNALYDAALKANFNILERHKHTKVIRGSLAERDRDATVKWNYVDLRFYAQFDFRIEVELTTDKLRVTFRSKSGKKKNVSGEIVRNSTNLNDCYSCGNKSCFKHPAKVEEKQLASTTTFILDEKWPEFDEYVHKISQPGDNFIVPLRRLKWIPTQRFSWKTKPGQKVWSTNLAALYRMVKMRSAVKNGRNIFEESLRLDRKIAERAVRLIPVESTHLVVSQNLLPFLVESGALGGRTYDVLMTRLPMEILHRRLDRAAENYPMSPTLIDFRAPKDLIELENKGLNAARKIVSPHEDIAALFQHKAEKPDWIFPDSKPLEKTGGSRVLFPASAVARKGAYEIKKLRNEMNLDLVVAGQAVESSGFWEGNPPAKFDGDFSKIACVIYPVHVEHQPRLVLKAISLGIPVITTAACGLGLDQGVILMEDWDAEKLKGVLEELALRNSKEENILT